MPTSTESHAATSGGTDNPAGSSQSGPQPGSLGGLPMMALAALVIGSMIGGGIFSLPQNIAETSAAGPMIIGWVITGIGMICLARVYQSLAVRKPKLDNGIYAYAKAGFGDYLGFNSAWGYWLSAWIGNVGYLVLIMSTMGKFFPIFAGGNTIWAVLGASVLLWGTHALVLSGIHTATVVNTITTIAKVIPLIVFVVICFIGFKFQLFTMDFWGTDSPDLGGVFNQTKSMMLVTVWVFIGIEGASIYSQRARKRSDVGKATMIGFVFVLALLVLVNMLSMGIMKRAKLAGLPDTSMADVLSAVVGPWGAWFIAIGVLISLLGGLLAWILLCGETMQTPGADGTMPGFFGRLNKKGAPANALWVTNILTQIMLLLSMLAEGFYLSMATLSAALILVPYLLSAGYALKIAVTGDSYTGTGAKGRKGELGTALVATIYSLWLLYAADLEIMLVSMLMYLPGIAVYVWAKREGRRRGTADPDRPLFIWYEYIVMGVIVVAAIAGIVLIATGAISLT